MVIKKFLVPESVHIYTSHPFLGRTASAVGGAAALMIQVGTAGGRWMLRGVPERLLVSCSSVLQNRELPRKALMAKVVQAPATRRVLLGTLGYFMGCVVTVRTCLDVLICPKKEVALQRRCFL